MKITWIGQAGLILKSQGKTVIVDPYLSDSVKKVNPNNYRRAPVDTNLFGIKPDIIILTHNHMDHTDEETLRHYITQDSRVTVLASGEAWKTVRKFGGAENNYVLFNCGTRWTDGSLRFCAVHAEHSDCCAIGVIVYSEGKRYYITGDTLYNERIFADIPKGIDVVFLPINGVGNNMNARDAKDFAERIGARKAVPIHWGMFDEIDPKIFKFEGSVIPHIYKEITDV